MRRVGKRQIKIKGLKFQSYLILQNPRTTAAPTPIPIVKLRSKGYSFTMW
jgi:hypothetical protein